MRRPWTAAGLLLLLLGGARTASAQIEIPLTISGNQASANISLPGGIAVELTITFENVVGLNSSSLLASVTLINPLDLIGRIPGLVSLPPSLPLLLRIFPSEGSPLSYSGVYSVSLYTHNLVLNPLVPLALFKGPEGLLLKDITTWEGVGSYRCSGSSGSFSEFIILVDLRPIDLVITNKFDDLQASLTEHTGSMPFLVYATLQSMLNQARAFYLAGATVSAINKMTQFSNYVKAHSGADIPDVWAAANPSQVNVAGLLRSEADTLKFSLTRKESQ